jgi:acylphosphatase
MTRQAVHLVVSGRVQGVGYRFWTANEAARLMLDGWVRNRPDGTVEAVLAGDAEALRQMVEACRRGPAHASVRTVTELPAPPDPGPGFRISSSERDPP